MDTGERDLRLFAAIVPPPAALDALEQVVRPLRRPRRGPIQLRWARREQWHLTLAFMAAVPPGRVDALTSALRAAAQARPAPTLRIAGAGAFPDARRARVLWAGVEGDAGALGDLAAGCREAAVQAGAELSDTRFSPHLTLARLRGPAAIGGLVDAIDGYGGPEFTAGEVVLIESLLGGGEAGRPRYEPRAVFPLGR